MNRNRLRALAAAMIGLPLLALSAHCQPRPLTPEERRAFAQTNTELNLSAGELHSLGLLAPEDHAQNRPPPTCPLSGTAKGAPIKAANLLKNRSALPKPADLDPKFTLSNVLKPGNDNTPPRWNEKKSGVLVGWVHNAKPGGIETVNCGAKAVSARDTHIELVLSVADSGKGRRVVVEVTPRMRAWAKKAGWDWSTPTLIKTLIGHEVSVAGWIFNDFEHAPNAENTHPHNKLNWRATTWELHPVTGIKVLK